MDINREHPGYDTLSEAMEALRKEGYDHDFEITPNAMKSTTSELELNPDDFHVDKFYRFEGMSNPDDNSILYAISGKGHKGLVVDAYGVYNEKLDREMVEKLAIR